jgi:nucleoside-diphosphate-sugar epimerase
MTDDSTLLPEPETTVLTGAAGWFGRGYLDALRRGRTDEVGPVARSGRVVALVASPEDVPAVLEVHPETEIHVGDVTDPEVVARLLADADGASLVHAAGVIHPAKVADFDRVNHQGTARVVEAAVKAGVRRMVHVSSNSPFGVNPRPDDTFRHDEPYAPYLGYGESKMAGELVVRSAVERGELEAVIVRPPWFYGPWQPLRQTTFFRMVRTGRFPLMGDGSNRRSMTYVDNLVQGVALAERHPAAAGQAYWVAAERPYTMAEVVDTVKRVMGEEGYDVAARQLRLPVVAGRFAERADRMLQSRGVYHQEMHVMGEMNKTIACDISRTTSDLGYRPLVDLEEGMRRSVRWCRDRGVDL